MGTTPDTPPSSRKCLLVTADDFGMCRAVNEGIVAAMTRGIVTSTNFMAPCPWFADAAALAKQHNLPCGLHLTLTCEWTRYRFGPLTRAPGLVAPDGGFWPTFEQLAETAKPAEIEAELAAQLAYVRRAGFEPTHVDTHMLNTADQRSCVQDVRRLVIELCDRENLRLVRHRPADGKSRYFVDQSSTSGRSLDEAWRTIESWTSPGCYHLVTHPAVASPELDAMCDEDEPLRSWATPIRSADLAFLCSVETKRRLAGLGFELIDVARLKQLTS